jgi:hypothetical protein
VGLGGGLEKSGAEIEAVEQRHKQAGATEHGEHLQGFSFDVSAGGNPGKSLNECSHLSSPERLTNKFRVDAIRK